ncbi:MAG: (Fe-S)-binding protein [Actinomycetota bacterium]|nr:(Fe-S)-binding protein [Actinomycetota bacterium]
MSVIWIVIILSAIGLVSGILIFIVNKVLPREPESLKRAEQVAQYLPGYNCGACGYPGCFAYAQAAAEDKDIITKNPCATVLQDESMLSGIEEALGLEIDTSQMNKKAVVHCYGVTVPLGDYGGTKLVKQLTAWSAVIRGALMAAWGSGIVLWFVPRMPSP